MATNLLSPGVEVREIDLTEVIQEQTVSGAAFVGQFAWGPVGVPTRVFDTDELEKFFGKPTNGKHESVDNRVDWYSASNFLDYANNLKIVRAISGVGHCQNAVANYTGSKVVVKNQSDFVTKYQNGDPIPELSDVEFVARYPGKRGNSLRISMADANTFHVWPYRKYFNLAPGTSAYAKQRGGENDELHIVIIDEDGEFNKSKIKGAVLEKFAFKSKASDALDAQNRRLFYGDVINEQSIYVRYVSAPNSNYFESSDRITNVYIIADANKTNSQNEYFDQNRVWTTVDNSNTNGSGLTVEPIFGQADSKILDLNITGGSGYSSSDTIVFKNGATVIPSVKGELIVNGSGAITGVIIKSYGTLPALGTAITTTITGVPTTESASVRFLNQTAGKTITLAGLTATIGSNGATDREIAAAFISGTSSANVVISGTLSGWTVSAGTDTTRALFTSTTVGANVTNLTKTGTGTIGGITTVSGSDGSGTGGVVAGTVVSGDNKIIGFNITDYGKGYTSAPTITINSNEGYIDEVQAIVHMESKNLSVKKVSITSAGSGYAAGDSLQFSNPANGIVALGYVNSVDIAGGITSLKIVNSGSGYISTPSVTVKSTTGTGATITAELTATNINEATLGIHTWGLPVKFLDIDGTYKPRRFKRLLRTYNVAFTNGSDDLVTERVRNIDLMASWDILKDPSIDDSALLITGQADAEVSTYVAQNIASVRKNCLAFLSPPLSTVNNKAQEDARVAIVDHRNKIGETSYATMDSGWKLQRDRFFNGYIWMPLNADIAGLCARVDQTHESWFSPAGTTKGQIKNVVSLAFNPDQDSRDFLYQNNVNPVISEKAEGTYLFGDLTLESKESAFSHINVRRLFLELERTISKGSKRELFEFNDIFTRSRFVAFNDPYLRSVQGRRGVYAYRIKCDETNNTPDVIDRGEFVASIYVEPARSINFIVLNFVATRTGQVSIQEIESIA